MVDKLSDVILRGEKQRMVVPFYPPPPKLFFKNYAKSTRTTSKPLYTIHNTAILKEDFDPFY